MYVRNSGDINHSKVSDMISTEITENTFIMIDNQPLTSEVKFDLQDQTKNFKRP